MKKLIVGIIVGLILGSVGTAGATGETDYYLRNGILCTPTGHGMSAGVVCALQHSNKLAIVSRSQIIVGNGDRVVYSGSSR